MSRIRDKILDYFIRSESTGDKGSEVLDKELSEDPAFDMDEFVKYEKIWNASSDLKEFRKADVDVALSAVEARIDTPQTSVRVIPMWQKWSAAAMIVIVLGFGFYRWFVSDRYVTYEAIVAESIVLPDSSIAHLGRGATLRYLKPGYFSGAEVREFYLTGDGTFEVRKDSSKLFSVMSDHTAVDALGTIFHYEARDKYSSTRSIEGRIRFRSRFGHFDHQHLTAGDGASFDAETKTMVPYMMDEVSVVGNLVVSKMTVNDLLLIMRDEFPGEFVVDQTADLRPEVVIQVNLDQELPDIISALQESDQMDFSYDEEGGIYTITRLLAEDQGWVADYTYEMYQNDVDFNHLSE